MITAIKALSVTPTPIPAFAPVGSFFVSSGEGVEETIINGEELTEGSLVEVKEVEVENEVKPCIMEGPVGRVRARRLKLEEDDGTVEDAAPLLEELKPGGVFNTPPPCARTSLNKIGSRNIWTAIFAIENGLNFIAGTNGTQTSKTRESGVGL
jgi:hypothetical protein